ncbi:hypothetical protein Taro_047587 [Colocasia esculenta]|uniref:Pentatricopeptide repeat-containing protein n=1 Tax=Colocasia esculenta TaxID=4460 RepID=A0A843X5L1_COLES|nr:hypothetical protein [Colocasia esculenta]
MAASPSPLPPPGAAVPSVRAAGSASLRPHRAPPLAQPSQHCLLASSSSLCPVESFLALPRAAAVVQPRAVRGGLPVAFRCSFSQVHSYGTVDYEQLRGARARWSSLYRRIAMTEDPEAGAAVELERWEEEERRLSKWELCRVVKELRKFRRFKLALDVYEWMTSQGDRFNIYSSDIAIQLDLMSKVQGISYAEDCFARLTEAFKDKRTYGALLNSYMHAKLKEKAEVVFETMKEKDYVTDPLPFNVMMTLYMNVGEYEKVKSIIREMEERRIPLDIFSYNIWITTCATRGNTDEMEEVFEQMNSDRSINPNWTTYSTLATMYIRLGNIEKAKKCLKDAEFRMTGRDRMSFNYLLGLYGLIGKKEEVYRIWDWYKASFPSILNTGYHSMLTSLVKVRDMEGADTIFKEWISTTSNYDPKIWNIMTAWYVREGMVTKAQACLDDLLNLGGRPNSSSWEILAEGYVQAKQISMALRCIKEAASVERPSPKKWRPRPVTIANFLVLCAEQNDTASVEVLVNVLKKVGCLDSEEYKSLINMYAGAAVQEKLRAQEQ